MKENTKSNYAKGIILTVALIVIGVSVTYAYFTSKIAGEAKDTSLQAGTLRIDTNLDSDSINAINNLKLHLIESADIEKKAESVSFYVKNTAESNISAEYDIYLTDISLSKNLYSKYFKWELLNGTTSIGNGTFENVTRTDTPGDSESNTTLTNVERIKLNTNKITIAPDSTDNLIFRMWLENNNEINQIELTNGNFLGKLYLEAIPVSQNQ